MKAQIELKFKDEATLADQLKEGEHLLCENFGGLSLTSLRVMLTVVDPDSPPTEPAMSLAWITTA